VVRRRDRNETGADTGLKDGLILPVFH